MIFFPLKIAEIILYESAMATLKCLPSSRYPSSSLKIGPGVGREIPRNCGASEAREKGRGEEISKRSVMVGARSSNEAGSWTTAL